MNLKSLIINSDDAISTRIFSKWLIERYSFSIDKTYDIEEETIKKLLEQKDIFDDILIVKNSNYKHYFFYNNEVIYIISKKLINIDSEKSIILAEIYGKDFKAYKKWYEYLKKIDSSVKNKNFIIEYHSFSINNSFGGVESSIEYFKPEKFEKVSSIYYKFYLDTNLLFESYLNSKAPILQLTGKPGIGKSKLISLFIKYLINNKKYLIFENKIKIARVVSNEVLSVDEFWVQLRQGGFSALILDDLDNILSKRSEEVVSSEDKMHNEIIKKLLTFTDGITNTPTKILISTNISYKNIDEALMRDMRLFDSLELRALKYDEAKEIWMNFYKLDENSFKSIFKEGSLITAATLAKYIDDLTNDNLIENDSLNRAYLKEDNISKLQNLREQKRSIGFAR